MKWTWPGRGQGTLGPCCASPNCRITHSLHEGAQRMDGRLYMRVSAVSPLPTSKSVSPTCPLGAGDLGVTSEQHTLPSYRVGARIL